LILSRSDDLIGHDRNMGILVRRGQVLLTTAVTASAVTAV
jgi:hypothetical protein